MEQNEVIFCEILMRYSYVVSAYSHCFNNYAYFLFASVYDRLINKRRCIDDGFYVWLYCNLCNDCDVYNDLLLFHRI